MQVTGSFPPMPCGVGDNTYALVKHIADRGHKVDVITSLKADTESPHKNVTIHNCMSGWSTFKGGLLVKTIIGLDPDIVHLQYPTKGYGWAFGPSMLGMQLKAKKHPAPYVVTLHEFIHANGLRKAAIVPLLSEAKLVISPSLRELDSLQLRFETLRRIPSKVIPIGAVLPSNYEQIKARIAGKRDDLLKKWKVPKDGIIVNYGFLQRHKGFEELLVAFKKIREAGYNTELWHIGGFDPFRKAYDRFIQHIVEHDFPKGIIQFKGFMDLEDAAEIFSIARVGVFPFTDGYSDRRSSMITFGHFDAPMITTSASVSEVNDRIKNHVVLVESGNKKMLAEKLEEIIANDAMYENQLERVKGYKDLYDWRMIAEKTEDLYVKLLEERPLGVPQPAVETEVQLKHERLKEDREEKEKKQ